MSYEIINPFTGKSVSHPVSAWKYSKEQCEAHIAENRLYWGKKGENTYPRLKRFLSELDDGMVPINLWSYKEVGTLDEGTKTVDALLGKDVFDYPKPHTLIKKMLQIAKVGTDDIILDFFSGSATTAHAVMQLNAEDGGNRHFIMVQLPEMCDEKSEAYKAGYKNICEIGKERIRRAGAKIETGDVGFKAFKLDSSNMKLWDDTPIEDGDLDTLFERMDEHIDGLKPGRSDADLVYEILLKMGYPLTAGVSAFDMGGLSVYNVADGEMLICLQEGITADHIETLAALSPQKIVLAERSLADDSAMSNAHYLLENRGIELKIV